MVWLDSYPADFQDHPQYPLMQRILEFCRSYRPATSELENKVTHRLEKFEKEEEIKGSLTGGRDSAWVICVRSEIGQ